MKKICGSCCIGGFPETKRLNFGAFYSGKDVIIFLSPGIKCLHPSSYPHTLKDTGRLEIPISSIVKCSVENLPMFQERIAKGWVPHLKKYKQLIKEALESPTPEDRWQFFVIEWQPDDRTCETIFFFPTYGYFMWSNPYKKIRAIIQAIRKHAPDLPIENEKNISMDSEVTQTAYE